MGVQSAVSLEQSPWYAPWLAVRRAERQRRHRRRTAGLALASFVVASVVSAVDPADLARGRSKPPGDVRRAAVSARQRMSFGMPLAETTDAHLGLSTARSLRRIGLGDGASLIQLPDRSFGLPPVDDPAVVAFVSQREVLRGDEGTGAIALTFDCEGTGEDLEAVLDVLAEHGARGTFFLLARMAEWWPEAAARVVHGGHQLASHGSGHEDFTTLGADAIVSDLAEFEVAMAGALSASRITPPPVRFFRFPYGMRNESTLAVVAAAGYQSVHWTIDPRGWRADRTPEQVEAIVAEHAAPGEIVLMHCSAAADRAALPAVLDLIAERGLRTATVAEIVRWEDVPPRTDSTVAPADPDTAMTTHDEEPSP